MGNAGDQEAHPNLLDKHITKASSSNQKSLPRRRHAVHALQVSAEGIFSQDIADCRHREGRNAFM